MVQWLRHHPKAGGLGSVPGQGTRSHMLQLNVLSAAAKTWCSQIIFFFLKYGLQAIKLPILIVHRSMGFDKCIH